MVIWGHGQGQGQLGPAPGVKCGLDIVKKNHPCYGLRCCIQSLLVGTEHRGAIVA